MHRYSRSHFLAFGVLPALNALALLIYGLGLATHGTGGAGRSLPALIGFAAICLLTAMVAAVKRGRDLGWAAWMTLLLFWVALGLGPLVLVLIAYLSTKRNIDAAEPYGPPPSPATWITWVWALINLAWPWMALAVLSKVL